MTRRYKTLAVVLACVAAPLGLAACGEPPSMEDDLINTYNARQCIIDREARHAGMYNADNFFGSSAKGAYQWLSSSWKVYLPWAEAHYGVVLTTPEEDALGARTQAKFASPYTQDLVTAYALVEEPQGVRPWTHKKCYPLIGTPAMFRDDAPLNEVPLFIVLQVSEPLEEVPVGL